MRTPRRNYTAAFKGDRTLAELTEKYDVHASQTNLTERSLIEIRVTRWPPAQG
ncbi:MAG: hypothetical protein WKH97_16670 [Casimicrobiaceae bacterium]